MNKIWKELYELNRNRMWNDAPTEAMYYADGRWLTTSFMWIVDDIYFGKGLVQSGYRCVEQVKADNSDFMERPDNTLNPIA